MLVPVVGSTNVNEVGILCIGYAGSAFQYIAVAIAVDMSVVCAFVDYSEGYRDSFK